MIRTIFLSLGSTFILLLTTVSEYFLLPALLVLAATAIGFWKLDGNEKSPLAKITIVFIASNIVVVASLFAPFINHNDLPWTGVSCMVTTSACFGYLLRDREYLHEKHTWFLVSTTLLLFIATRALASIDRYDIGFSLIWGYFLAFGLLLGYLKFSLAKVSILLAPQVLLPLLLVLQPGFDPSQWIVSLLQPLMVAAIFIGAYLFLKTKSLIRWSVAVPSLTVILFYHLQIQGYLFGQSQESIHETLAPYSFLQLSGDTIRSKELEGKVVWMSFYSSKCGACARELPHVAAVADKFKGNPKVDFLAVNSIHFESFEKFRDSKVFHSFGLKTAYEYEDNLGGQFAPTGVPVGILVDQNGVAVFKKDGFRPSDKRFFEDWLTEEINALLNKGSQTGFSPCSLPQFEYHAMLSHK